MSTGPRTGPGKRRPVGVRVGDDEDAPASPKTCHCPHADRSACGHPGDLVGGSAYTPDGTAAPSPRGVVAVRFVIPFALSSRLRDLRDSSREGDLRDQHDRSRGSTGHRVRLPPAGPGPGAQEGDRGLLEGPRRRRPAARHRRATAPRQLAGAGRRRHRRGAHRRLLVLRPRARHHRHGRRGPRAAPRGRGRRPAGRVLRHGPRHPGRGAAGDDQVVRHQLPLLGTRVGA